MIQIRKPESIFQIEGPIENGTFHGRWHFSFGEYYDPGNMGFGPLRVFNDDTLSPGAVWPLHPHRDIEVVTYCAEGEFRHADEGGEGGVLMKGWVQHTTVGRGMWHSEINNRQDAPMRFIQMWFTPSQHGLKPSMEQKRVEKRDRTNRFLRLVSNDDSDALPLFSKARVLSCFLEGRRGVEYELEEGRGAYLYLLEGGPVSVSGHPIPALGAAKITGESKLRVGAVADSELLLVDGLLV